MEEINESEWREAFSFFGSYYDALQLIKDKRARCDAYDALCGAGLKRRKVSVTDLDGIGQAVLMIALPVIESNNKKSENRKGKTNKPKTKPKQNDDSAQEQTDNKTTTKPEQNDNKTGTVPLLTGIYNKNMNLKQEQEQEDTPPLPPQRGDVGKKFDRFWETYPKKKAKGDAEKAFTKALKTVTLETMLAALETQKESEQWKRDGGQYIPYPATWLNQRRWEDEADTVGSSPNVPDYDYMGDSL